MANFLANMKAQKQAERRAQIYRNLIRREAKIGGQLFGSVPEGHRREFFCLDPNTWVWHEEWNENGQLRVITTRYDVRPNGVLKTQNGQNHHYIDKGEALNLYKAIKLYLRKVDSEIYSPATA